MFFFLFFSLESDLAEEYDISSVPTFLFFKEGRQIKQVTGEERRCFFLLFSSLLLFLSDASLRREVEAFFLPTREVRSSLVRPARCFQVYVHTPHLLIALTRLRTRSILPQPRPTSPSSALTNRVFRL